MNNNPFDSLRQLGQMGEQLQKMLGNDFMKNWMGSNPMQGMNGMQGMPGMEGNTEMTPNLLKSDTFQNLFNWAGGHYPRADLYQTRNEVIAIFELPGLEKRTDVKLFVDPNRLRIKGNQKISYSNIAKEQFIISERKRSFERDISLPVRVLPRKVNAFYRKGLLEVHMIKDGGSKGDHDEHSIPVEFE